MSWVSVEKFKTVCEAIKNYVIGQADDAYNKAVEKMGDYVKKSGDTMTGVLNMGYHNITQLPEPANDTSATNKKYVDDAIESATGSIPDTYVKKSGDTMTGALNVIEPTEDSNATTKKYVDDAISGSEDKYVLKTGDTMSGNLSIETKSSTPYATPAYFTASAGTTPSSTGITKYFARFANYGISLLKAYKYSDGNYEYSLEATLDYRINHNYVFLNINGGIQKDGKSQANVRKGICVQQVDFNYVTGTSYSLSIGVDKDTTRLAVGNMVNPNVGTLIYKRLAVGTPTADEDATTKKYVDDANALKVNTTDEMSTTELNTILALFA